MAGSSSVANIIATLNDRFGIKGMAHFDIGLGGMTRLVLSTGGATAHVYLHGAQVTHYQPAGQPRLLFLSDFSHFRRDKPIRGGVPICFPWFGPEKGPGGVDLPQHGFARLRPWQVQRVADREDGSLEAILLLEHNEITHDLWPGNFRAAYRVNVGVDALRLDLAITNADNAKAFDFEAALHTYLAVSDPHKVSLRGLENTTYFDKTDAFARKKQGDEPLALEGETDRVYVDTATTCTVDDPGLRRRITVEKKGSNSTVVWNPWKEKSAKMEDFGAFEWLRMLCVESANVDQNAVKLKPGQTHEMSVTLRSQPLD